MHSHDAGNIRRPLYSMVETQGKNESSDVDTWRQIKVSSGRMAQCSRAGAPGALKEAVEKELKREHVAHRRFPNPKIAKSCDYASCGSASRSV